MKCSCCGNELPPDAMFCPGCGAKTAPDTASEPFSDSSELDAEFSALKAKAKSSSVILILICAVSVAFLFLTGTPFITIAGLVAALIYYLTAGRKNLDAFRLFHSEKIVKGVLESKLSELVYIKDRYIDEESITSCGIMPFSWDIIRGSDFVSGKYKNINVKFSDISLIEETTSTDSNGNTHTSENTRFKGKYVIFGFNKSFSTDIIIRERAFGSGFLKLFSCDEAHRVKMESSAFNDKYDVFANDPHNAFYVLTPHFMERLMTFEASHEGRIFMCFTGGMLHIAIDDGSDSFEAKLSDNSNVVQMRQKAASELASILSVVDALSSSD